MRPLGEGYWGRVVGAVHSSRFGLGGGRFHVSQREEEADTVYMGTYHRKVFQRVGFFNERLVRNQDIEFNGRVKASGGSVVLSPTIRSWYYIRDSFKGFLVRNFQNAVWNVAVLQETPSSLSPRHLIPLLFVLMLGSTSFLGTWLWPARVALGIVLFLYGTTALITSIWTAAREGVRYLPGLLLAFLALHVMYGFGFLVGFVRFGIPRALIGPGFYVNLVRPRAPGAKGSEKFNPEITPSGKGLVTPRGGGLKLSVIIPVYNEKGSILTILEKVKNAPFDKEIIVVDDGSTDGTREILRSLNEEGVKVFFHSQNGGKGAALSTGLKHATGDIILFQDADLEYDPADYPSLIAPLLDQGAQVVYGVRFVGRPRGYRMHYLGNRFLTIFTNLLYGSNLGDMEVGYKVFRREVIQGLRLKAQKFDIEPEVTAKLLKRGLKIFQVPISYNGRTYQEGKKIRLRDGFAAVWTLLKYRFVD